MSFDKCSRVEYDIVASTTRKPFNCSSTPADVLRLVNDRRIILAIRIPVAITRRSILGKAGGNSNFGGKLSVSRGNIEQMSRETRKMSPYTVHKISVGHWPISGKK